MAGTVSGLRARIRGLLDGSAGVSSWVLTVGRFHASDVAGELEDHPVNSIERAFTVHIDSPVAMEPVNTLSGYALYQRRLRVKLGYAMTATGDEATYENTGEQSGASTREAIEDRADEDANAIRAVIGSLRNWAGITGVSIIDVAPSTTEPDALEFNGERAINTITFTIKSRDALPGSSYGPSL